MTATSEVLKHIHNAAIKLTRVEQATQHIIHFQKRMHLCNFLRSNKPLWCFVPTLALHLIFRFIHTVRRRTQPQTPWLVETNILRKHRLKSSNVNIILYNKFRKNFTFTCINSNLDILKNFDKMKNYYLKEHACMVIL